jgi:diadenosine tetraphosphate (Ap4A) HIT family hydrolase
MGHALVLPLQHVVSVAELSGDASRDFFAVRNEIVSLLENKFGPLLQFEHGVREGDSGGCGIDHAHLHVLPCPSNVTADVVLADFPHRLEIDDLEQIGAATGERSYLFVKDANNRARLALCDRVPSQYLRRRVAALLGMERWDWRTASFRESFALTTAELGIEPWTSTPPH